MEVDVSDNVGERAKPRGPRLPTGPTLETGPADSFSVRRLAAPSILVLLFVIFIMFEPSLGQRDCFVELLL